MKNIILYMIITGLMACKDPAPGKQDKIMHDFDSVNQRLNELNDRMGQTTAALYDSITAKYGEVFAKQIEKSLTDSKNYLKSLRARFIVHCGAISETTIPDSTYGKTILTEQFFIEKKNGESLFYKLTDLQKTLSAHNDDPLLDEEINKLIWNPRSEGAAAFANTYFVDVPPVAAFTILSKFANDINVLEKKVLQQILR